MPRCSTTRSTARRSTRCWRQHASRSPTSGATCGAKAQILGLERSPGTTCSRRSAARAECGATTRRRQFIVEQFGTYSERMRDFAERAFRENWIDAEPREGKRDGAFCMPRPGRRVAGHGQLHSGLPRRIDARARARTRLPQHQSGRTHAHPAADADDAGRDREHLLRDDLPRGRAEGGRAARDRADRDPRGVAAGGRRVVVDILSRFLFESRLFEAAARARAVGRGALRR